MRKTRAYTGFGLHALVAAIMIFSAAIKILELTEPGESLKLSREYVLLLAVGELANALLLLIPRTMSLGVLITSAGWGAVIALCLMESNPHVAPMHPVVPMGFLAVTWAGGYLRDSRMLYSFSPPEHCSSESER